MDEETRNKLHVIEEAINDWKKGELSDFSAFYAIHIIMNVKSAPSKKSIRWAIDSLKKRSK